MRDLGTSASLRLPLGLLLVLLLGGCMPSLLATATPAATQTPTPTSSPAPTAPPTPAATSSPAPTAVPALALDPPPGADPRQVEVSIEPQLPADGDGRIIVRVTSLAEARIDELVLRWPTELDEALFLAPFTPTPERIADGGDPLVQPWTKWVVGSGEQGEPAGTTSLGWGPLLAGATLEIPVVVTRVTSGPVAFDLQVLAGNDLLQLSDGRPAEVRVELP